MTSWQDRRRAFVASAARRLDGLRSSFVARVKALRERQRDLKAAVLTRLDKEKVERIRSGIDKGTST